MVSPLDRHVALIGFMGAGKSTIGEEVAERIGRAFVDVDRKIEANAGDTISEIFRSWGEAGFREIEEKMAAAELGSREPRVLALGGGALKSAATRRLLRERAPTVLVEIDVANAWERTRGGDRPLAQDEEAFRRLYDERLPAYEEAADAVAHDADDAVLVEPMAVVWRALTRFELRENLKVVVVGDGTVALITARLVRLWSPGRVAMLGERAVAPSPPM